jgi:hypothetical protein
VDRAVIYVVAARIWQVLAGPISLFVILRCYSEAEQGLFYMFANLVLWHGFVELGLQTVIVLIASHEWAHLSLDPERSIVGSETALLRLAGLSQSTFRWYAGVSGLFAVAIGGCGYILLTSRDTSGVDWQLPWAGVVLLTAPAIWMSSRVAILEGCNQLGTINRCRFVQAVAGNLAVWTAMLCGLGLWAAVVSAAVRLLADGWLLWIRYRPFFKSLPSEVENTAGLWRDEVWPLQWRMAVRSLFAHLGMPLLLPVIYAYQGPAAAGLVGMTLTILQAVDGAAHAWIQTRTPRLGMFAARREFGALDRLFQRIVLISTVVLAMGGGLFAAAVSLLPRVPLAIALKLSLRLEDAVTTLLLLAGMLVFHVIRCLGAYVYVHKRDPFLMPQAIASCGLGLCTWYGGRTFGTDGAVAGYLLGINLVFLPIWLLVCARFRKERETP